MTKEQEQELKNKHSNFLAMPEMGVLLGNLKKGLEEQIVWILHQATYGTVTTDSMLRNKAARAQAAKEIIDYVQDYKSLIVGPR